MGGGGGSLEYIHVKEIQRLENPPPTLHINNLFDHKRMQVHFYYLV